MWVMARLHYRRRRTEATAEFEVIEPGAPTTRGCVLYMLWRQWRKIALTVKCHLSSRKGLSDSE